MELLFLGVAVGIIALGLGVELGHRLTLRAMRKRICKINTPDDHRKEAARLIHESMVTPDDKYSTYLRNQAYGHYVSADRLENGPYKS